MIKSFVLASMVLFSNHCLAAGKQEKEIVADVFKETKLLRFPTIHGDMVVFTYAGDLYSSDLSGGVARKLTSSAGVEMFAKFSPDGKYIAFTGQYDGNTEVYVIPALGGEPKRLTYTATLERDDVSDRMGPNNIVMGWKDDQTIIFRSRRVEHNSFKGQLYTVNMSGGDFSQIPLSHGGWISFSSDKNKFAFNKIFREFRTWKRYRGGQAADIFIYDQKTKEMQNITNHPAQDIFPMWAGDKIYFVSDRDGRDHNRKMNLYRYDTKENTVNQITFYEKFDIKFPSLGDDSIIFENGGELYRMQLNDESIHKLTFRVQDDQVEGRRKLVSVKSDISYLGISPDGNRASVAARGDIFTIPKKEGEIRNLTQSSGHHDRSPEWSPDGKWIAYISDATGEDEIWLRSPLNDVDPIQLTKNSDNYKLWVSWSPDSQKIMWADRKQRLRYIDVKSKQINDITQSDSNTLYAKWSPDSNWVAYSTNVRGRMSQIFIHSLRTKNSEPVTDPMYSSFSPQFSDDGKFLFFVSSRTFSPKMDWLERNFSYNYMGKIYFVTLNRSVESPFKYSSDEVQNIAVKKNDKKSEEEKDTKKALNIKIDFDGIMDRTLSIPTEAGFYRNIQIVADSVYYISATAASEKSKLNMYSFKDKKETLLAESVMDFEISANKEKMIVSQNNDLYLLDLPKAKLELKDKLGLEGLKVWVDRDEEWKQIFNESWRQMRDFFYMENMHGMDWLTVKSQYAALLPYVNHRIDLTYLIGEMISELNVGHAYVGGGDYTKAPRVDLGLLGAEFSRNKAGDYFKISKILKGENWDSSLRSPLTEVGIDANVGDFVIAIDGKQTNSVESLYELLVDKAEKQVELEISSTSDRKKSRKVIVKTIKDEQPLYYFNWVLKNIAYVNKKTNGKVGYIHIPDMGIEGLNQFMKTFYPQLDKKALVIDDRGNGGGFVSPIITEKLLRKPSFLSYARNGKASMPWGEAIHAGPKVLLLDEYSASDGDLFPYRFRKNNIGKLIGKRSWGGVVGISGSLPMIDGGSLTKPEFASFDLEGKEWIIEGRGVSPDIEVENHPGEEFLGVDSQLDKAIEVVLEELKTKEFNLPEIPAAPIKNP